MQEIAAMTVLPWGLPWGSYCPQEYKEVLEPLVLEECACQILRGVDEGEVLTPHKAVKSCYY